jgi:hypothetical protein
MKRILLCAVAALLATGALAVKPADACTTNPACAEDSCPAGKTCNLCSGRCI